MMNTARRRMMYGPKASSAADGLDLSGLSTQPYIWYDGSDLGAITLIESDVTSVVNKGTLSGNFAISGTPKIVNSGDSTTRAIEFLNHPDRMSISTPAAAKFLHDGTKYLVAHLSTRISNGGGIYSTVDRSASNAKGVVLFGGFWGSSFQTCLHKIQYAGAAISSQISDGLDYVSDNSVIITETMRGYTPASGNQWELYKDGLSSPLLVNNSLNAQLSNIVNDNPDLPFTINFFESGSIEYTGLRQRQMIIIKYPNTTPEAAIDADRIYIRNTLNSFYQIY